MVFQRSPNYTIPMPNHPWSDEDLQRIRQEYPERRHASAYAPAGTPHGTYHKNALDTDPEERDEAMWQRWRDGGVLFSKTFPDQRSVLAANDIARQFAEDRIREIVDDPAVAEDLIPTDHPIGTKRICTDAGYYATFNRDNVRLVNLRREPIEAITTDGVRTASSDLRVRCAGVRDGFRRADGRDDADRPGRSGRAAAVGDLGRRAGHVPRGDGAAAAEPVQLQRAGQPVGAGEHGAARRGAGGLGRRADGGGKNQGITEVEPRRDAAKAWTDHVAEAAERTLFPRAESSWYLGSNIDGKKRVFMPYIGGFGNYRRSSGRCCGARAIRGWSSPRDELPASERQSRSCRRAFSTSDKVAQRRAPSHAPPSLDAMSRARAVTARRSGASVSSSHVAAAAHVVAVPSATACTAAAAAGDLGLGLRPRNRLHVVMIMIVSTVASWHVDPLGRRD